MGKKKRLLLVSPNDFATTYGDFRHSRHLIGNTGRLLNVSLPTIAALTPKDEFEIEIVDENATPIDFSKHYDIVGTTGFPPQLFRARELAAEFRKRGSLVVCGGTSASLSPDRWRSAADVLIKGEAELIWPQFIRDYLKGEHKDTYEEPEKLDLAHCPLPDYSGFAPEAIKEFAGGIVQTSRGCPFDCEFCDAIIFAGRKSRYKPIENIIKEVEQIQRLGLRYVYLADDNFGANRRKSKEILRALADWNSKQKRPMPFLTQLTIDLSKEDEFMELAAAAGLTKVFIGLETPNLESLKESHKMHNIKTNMVDGVKRFHRYGIEVAGGCVVGFDHDDLTIFKRQVEFFQELGVPNVQVYPLNAPDATPLQARMIKEGRYRDWEKANVKRSKYFSYFNSYNIEPKLMNVEQLQQGLYWLLWTLYDHDNFVERVRVYMANYEEGSEKANVTMPSPLARLGIKTLYNFLKNDRAGVEIVARITKYLLTKGSWADRKAFYKLVTFARKSTHPQRWGIIVNAFITLYNTRQMLIAQAPGIEQTPYPVGGPPPPSRKPEPEPEPEPEVKLEPKLIQLKIARGS
jgi:radical SAM superfamily enzyme YgiQ (UPF0313 family)